MKGQDECTHLSVKYTPLGLDYPRFTDAYSTVGYHQGELWSCDRLLGI